MRLQSLSKGSRFSLFGSRYKVVQNLGYSVIAVCLSTGVEYCFVGNYFVKLFF